MRGVRPMNSRIDEKRFAKEWLYFLGSLAFGLTILPAVIMLADGELQYIDTFYKALFEYQHALIAWLLVLAPYAALQFIRSIVWAVKIVRMQ